ncbi:unnamed protein product [Prunus armeniaca]
MLVKKCDKCQRFGSVPYVPAEPLSPIVSPWPFAQWGLDLIGPMPEGKGQVKYAVVVIDYFTKWVEAKALATITTARIEDFVWTNICCRFGIPTPSSRITAGSLIRKSSESSAFASRSTCSLLRQLTPNRTARSKQ